MIRDFRRYLQRTPVLQLAAGLAVAQAAIGFLSHLFYGVVILPIAIGGSAGFEFFGFGLFSVDGRTFAWLDPAAHLLVLGAILALAYAVPRQGVKACLHCFAEIPAGARVCRSCTREIAT